MVKATISAPKTAALNTNAVRKVSVVADFACSCETSALKVNKDEHHRPKNQGKIRTWLRGREERENGRLEIQIGTEADLRENPQLASLFPKEERGHKFDRITGAT